MERASNLRMIALASVAALAVALPLAAATAGPAGHGKAPVKSTGLIGDATRNAAKDAADPTGSGKSTDDKPKDSPSQAAGLLGESGLDLPSIPGVGTSSARPNIGGQSSASANCGPQLTSRNAVEAQTCVLTDGHDTWGRTYYRNMTGGPLAAVLTLLRPDQRTVVVHCPVAAAADPRVCETPHDPTVTAGQDALPYQAVAEFAAPEGDRVLLHAGSDDGRDPGQ
ncbi:hypothetical protein ACFOSC_13930 [Streptantibioticus rubrisoli]|uniref:Uncharacterized protein n=1 Tax=Streptantibioticus rubrisoli TaxID=1387313 RepID=A0ABT1PES8_9ACTN|nr:hypothetical protein [Streptantibioticus rubrisoli]MCQ4042978.1 hypothetical protein [Streptantibioticus rubrisoli]